VLAEYDWPGNVRELRNVIERAVVLSGASRIDPEHLPEHVRSGRAATSESETFDMQKRVAAVERDVILAALEASRGNQTHAARKLGISRFALIRLMDKLEIKRGR